MESKKNLNLESQEIATKDSVLMVENWLKNKLIPMPCFYASLSIIMTYLVILEKKKKLDLNIFLQECVCNAKRILDEMKEMGIVLNSSNNRFSREGTSSEELTKSESLNEVKPIAKEMKDINKKK